MTWRVTLPLRLVPVLGDALDGVLQDQRLRVGGRLGTCLLCVLAGCAFGRLR